jgi:AAA15 family ATPase/GTPase
MLIRFNIKNFLSFADRKDVKTGKPVSQEFSMIPGRMRTKMEHIDINGKQDLLKFSAVYGANAAGKSNLVKAFRFVKEMVKTGVMPAGASEQYCKVGEMNRGKSSYFELEILLGEKSYSYGFEIILNTGIIVSEWLCDISTSREIYLFKKEAAESKYEFAGGLEKIKDLTVLANSFGVSGSLFLSLINKNMAGFYEKNPQAGILSVVYDWITKNLDVFYPEQPLGNASFLASSTSFDEISKLLKAFGTGIVKVKPVPVPLEKTFGQMPPEVRAILLKQIEGNVQAARIKAAAKKKKFEWTGMIRDKNDIFLLKTENEHELAAYSIEFEHPFRDGIVPFKIADESDGTARLFDLLEILVSKAEKTYVIDELDRCLHPSLTYQFVKTFFESVKNRHVQLVVTTHESRLMDFDLLRRDEIWFVDKRKTGESDMYSLEEYNTRFDQKVDKAYLEGRYGGVPVFMSLFPVE